MAGLFNNRHSFMFKAILHVIGFPLGAVELFCLNRFQTFEKEMSPFSIYYQCLKAPNNLVNYEQLKPLGKQRNSGAKFHTFTAYLVLSG